MRLSHYKLGISVLYSDEAPTGQLDRILRYMTMFFCSVYQRMVACLIHLTTRGRGSQYEVKERSTLEWAGTDA
jgi:hypothetical protein